MKKQQDPFKMSECELADYIDELITHKMEEQKLPKDVSKESIYKDIYLHIRIYFRMLQLQLNHIKARADMGKYFFIAFMKHAPEELKDSIIKEVTRLKDEDNLKIMGGK